MRPPPRSTLFPYTTLFRSNVVVMGAPIGHRAAGIIVPEAEVHVTALREIIDFGRLAEPEIPIQLCRNPGWFEWAIDRKSTRLNSSHPSISYAVFCLKKKKK